MHRNQNPGQNPRHNAERDAAQPIAGQPRSDEEEDALQEPEQVPSFLTARELQVRDTAKSAPRADDEASGDDDDDDEKPAKPVQKTQRKGGEGKAK